jgi:glycosyltransferase involved in cell wall biosynthesis
VVFLSRLDPKKNLESLLEAWPQVRRNIPEATLRIVGGGDGEYATRLEEKARQLDAAVGGVEVLGFVSPERKAQVLSTSAVFVLPSRHENFGVAALEAAAHGVPSILSAEVQLSPFIIRHGLGLVSDTSSISLAETIVHVLRSDVLRAHCETVGPRVVEENFSIRRVGASLRELYATLSPTPATY